MFLSQSWVAKKLGIGPQTRVLDIGGSAARFEHGQVTVVDIAAPDWSCARFVELDVCQERLPFLAREFDVCICTQTLEDLYNPFGVMKEMQRVAQRGYVETPHRGLESSFEISTNQGGYPGWGHHHWMFERVDPTTIRLIPKMWHLMRDDAQKIMKWLGPSVFEFFWFGHFAHEEVKIMDARGDHWHPMLAEHNDFVARNRHQLITLEDAERQLGIIPAAAPRGNGGAPREPAASEPPPRPTVTSEASPSITARV